MKKNIHDERHLNSTLSNYRPQELEALERYSGLLEEHFEVPNVLLYNFIRTVRTQEVTKLVSLWEVFKQIVNIHGSIVEIGVLEGFNIFSLAHFSEILEHRNCTRKICGFDTFAGYESRREDKDKIGGELTLPNTYSLELLQKCVDLLNRSIVFSQFKKMELVQGDAVKTIPAFIKNHPEFTIALLLCQCGMYEPTKVALQHFLPRMPKGGIVLFGTLNYPETPGELLALLDEVGLDNVKLQRLPFATKLSYFVKE